MRLSFLLVTAALFLCSLPLRSQLVSMTDTAAFGSIKEIDGPKSIRIYVKNEGTAPTAILKVRPTCGCTAAEFYKGDILPGDSAWIDLTYNPYRRPGRFEKGVKVYSTDGEMIRVPITGTVFSSPETIAGMFPSDGGLLHLSETRLMTLTPLVKDSKTLFVDVYNSTGSPVFTLIESDSPAVETQTFPTPVPSGEKGLIGIYLDPVKETRKGPVEYTLKLYTSHNPESPRDTGPVTLTVNAEISK